MEEVRSYIKTWEHDFQRANGRLPGKEDIKRDPVITVKYKQYRYYKQGKPEKAKEIKVPLLQPVTPRKKRVVQLTTPQKTSPSFPLSLDGNAVIMESPVIVTELGPTPQLNGRVMSIFDILRSPQKSPLKNRTNVVHSFSEVSSEGNDGESKFETPTKKKLNFNLNSKPISKLNTLRTPSKTPRKTVQETPGYFNDETPYHITIQKSMPAKLLNLNQDTTEDDYDDASSVSSQSPLSQRIKPISKLIRELDDIKDDLKYGDYDIDMLISSRENSILSSLNAFAEEEPENIGDSDATQNKPWERKIKRQTRRVKMKARPMEDHDIIFRDSIDEESEDDADTRKGMSNLGLPRSNILNLKLHRVCAEALPESLQNTLNATTTTTEQEHDQNMNDQNENENEYEYDNENENEEWSEEETPYVKNTTKYEGKKKVYSNFKSLRINKPKRGNFGRRRR